jgi:hypothetical protein
VLAVWNWRCKSRCPNWLILFSLSFHIIYSGALLFESLFYGQLYLIDLYYLSTKWFLVYGILFSSVHPVAVLMYWCCNVYSTCNKKSILIRNYYEHTSHEYTRGVEKAY